MKDRLLFGMMCALLFAVTGALYSQVSHFAFINFDDPVYLTQNHHLQQGLSFRTVAWAFSTKYATNWHPLTWISHLVDFQLFGLEPGGHHLTSVWLHCLNVALLFAFLARATGNLWPSFLVAALFGWHPLHVESVAWVSERKDVLSAFFFLLTLNAYVRFVHAKQASRVRFDTPVTQGSNQGTRERRCKVRAPQYYVLALVFFILGLMSKPMLVTLPFVMVLLDYWPLSRCADQSGLGRNREAVPSLLLEKVPFFVLSAIACVVTYWAQAAGGAVASLVRFTLQNRIENAVVAYALYLQNLIWPTRLAVFYPHFSDMPFELLVAAGLALFAVTALAVWQAVRRPYLLVGWLWYLGMLVPVIGLVQVGEQAYADRYSYLPLIGIFIALAWSLRGALEGKSVSLRRIAIGATAVWLASCLFGAHRQLEFWKNSETLFRHAVAVTEDNYVAHNSLGNTLTDLVNDNY